MNIDPQDMLNYYSHRIIKTFKSDGDSIKLVTHDGKTLYIQACKNNKDELRLLLTGDYE